MTEPDKSKKKAYFAERMTVCKVAEEEIKGCCWGVGGG